MISCWGAIIVILTQINISRKRDHIGLSWLQKTHVVLCFSDNSVRCTFSTKPDNLACLKATTLTEVAITIFHFGVELEQDKKQGQNRIRLLQSIAILLCPTCSILNPDPRLGAELLVPYQSIPSKLFRVHLFFSLFIYFCFVSFLFWICVFVRPYIRFEKL